MITENGYMRDYKHEHELRKKRVKRLLADIDKNKVDEFKLILKTRGVTYSQWLENKINEEIKRTV